MINKTNSPIFSGLYCFELTKLWFERSGSIPGEIPGIKLHNYFNYDPFSVGNFGDTKNPQARTLLN